MIIIVYYYNYIVAEVKASAATNDTNSIYSSGGLRPPQQSMIHILLLVIMICIRLGAAEAFTSATYRFVIESLQIPDESLLSLKPSDFCTSIENLPKEKKLSKLSSCAYNSARIGHRYHIPTWHPE